MRKAFSMITAIFIILLMATVSALIVNISAKTVKTTTMQYRHEQAILYAKSYTELAIMFATANDARSGTNCAENINGSIGNDPSIGNGYNIQTTIAYIGTATSPLVCSAGSILDNTTVIRPNQLQIIVDVYVRYLDPSVLAMAGSAPWITYHKRTLQKL